LKPRTILLIVPYKARDLEGHALVAYHLEKFYGHKVILTNAYRIERKLMKYAPDALVLDHLAWNFKAEQARMAKRLGLRVFVLPTEGLFQKPEDAVETAGKLNHVTQIVDSYFTWGNYLREAVLNQRLMTENQIFTVGCPRFDFYSEPYVTLAEPKTEFLRRLGIENPDNPLIVWTTNTPNFTRSHKKIIDRYVKRAGWNEQRVRNMLADETAQFQHHSRMVRELAVRHLNWNFIIKVHPAEWINPYVRIANEVPNIHLAFDAPIRNFLLYCDVLMQRNCTTATEAWMLGKPVLDLNIGKYHFEALREYKVGSHVINSLDEADELIKSYLSGLPIPEEQQRAREAFIAEFYHRIDGKAAARCAEQMNRLLLPPYYTDEDQLRTRAAVNKEFERWKQAEDTRPVNRLKDFLRIDRGVSLRVWKKMLRGEARDNLGWFVPEVEIQPEMVGSLYGKYDGLFAGAASL
jgi:surface carbohydrate biosynthesis protein